MNLWKRFQDLIPHDPLLVGTVLAHHADGTSTVELLGGGTLRVRGQDVAIGTAAWVRAGVIEGEAPTLSQVEIEV